MSNRDFYSEESYLKILKDQFARRKQRNSSYSLRAFSRDIGVSTGHLSQVLNGNEGLSRQTAEKVCSRLKFALSEQEFFCDLVESVHGRSEIERKSAKARLKRIRHNKSVVELKEDVFACISEWYHMAILELLEVDGFESDSHWIAKALKISHHEASEAIDRLIRLKLLKVVGGKLKSVDEDNVLSSEVPSKAIRNFHKTLLARGLDSIENQDVDDRELQSLVLSFNTADLPKAKEKIREFAREFSLNYSDKLNVDSVYALQLLFYRLGSDSNMGEKED